VIRIVKCVVVTCDRCQEPGHPIPDEVDGEVHFTSIADAMKQLPDWRLNPGRGHAQCAGCAAEEDCATQGHDLEDDWRGCGCRGRLPAHLAAITVDAILTSTCPVQVRRCRRCEQLSEETTTTHAEEA
jgi:hypothetical protein